VPTLRAKLRLLCEESRRAQQWNAELAADWIARQQSGELYFYCNGHVRVYHGEQTSLPRHYVARERLCLRATADCWVNAMDGQLLLYVNKEADPGLIATLKLRQVFQNEADLLPDEVTNTLTVRLRDLTQAAPDEAVGKLGEELNATPVVFPGSSLRRVFKLGSS